MKKLIALALLMLPLLVFSQAPADTVASIVNPQSIVISKKNGTTVVTVSGTKKNPDYKYRFEVQNATAADTVTSKDDDEEWGVNLPFVSKNGRRKSTFVSFAEDIYSNMVWPDAKSSGVKTSWEMGIGRLFSLNWLPCASSNTKLTFGVGIGARKISFKHDRRLYFSEGHLSLGVPNENEAVKSSNILESEFRFPFMLTQPIYKDFKVSFGFVGLLNVYSSASTTLERDGSKFTEKYKGLHQRTLNCELVGTIGFDDALGVTVHYRPLSDFGSVYGPEFKTVSLGISINF